MISQNLCLSPLLSCIQIFLHKVSRQQDINRPLQQQVVWCQKPGSSKTAQSGLELRIDSTSVRTVARTSSSARLSPSTTFRAVWVLHISLSQTPLACEAFDGWNTYWHPFCRSSSWIWCWFQFSMACLISWFDCWS